LRSRREIRLLKAVRRRLALFALALACPAAAHAQVSAVTLKAPGATRFGHRIEFVGRINPSAPGTRVRILRTGAFVAAGAVRGDGTFRIPVRIGQPGPFVAVAGSTRSEAISIRIVPQLAASLVGSRVVGSPLTLVAKVQPAQAGALRVRVVRGGRETLVASYRGQARVALGTARADDLHVEVATIPRQGYIPLSKTLDASLAPPMLAYGSTSTAVAELAHRLAAIHYAVPSFSSTFSPDLIESVYAFQKVEGLPRTGVADSTLWAKLADAEAPAPRYNEPADHIEVDKARQVLFIVRDGQVALISPVSTAGIPGYYTPTGRFAIYRKVVGYDPSPLGVLLDPMYFVAGYAIHGNPSVPPYPASHGCIRVPNFVIYRLFRSEPYGETVYVY
jgi:peptidoglycan hydrolase-like protein with peptidoglycan-binding domain